MKFISRLLVSSCVLLTSQAVEPTGTQGVLSRSIWHNVPGYTLEHLQLDSSFYDIPGQSDTPVGFPIVNPAGDYGQKYQGYLTAPVTGEYRFWITGDDNCALWLGSSDDKFSKQKIANLEHWTNLGWFGHYRAQASQPVTLQAGQRYYLEAQHKDGYGAHHFSAIWSYAGGSGLTNWAMEPGAVATQTSTEGSYSADLAIDGNTSGTVDDGSIAVTQSEAWAKWFLDLGAPRLIDRVEIFNRNHDGANVTAQLQNYTVVIKDAADNIVKSQSFQQSGSYTFAVEYWETGGVTGQKIEIIQLGGQPRYLNLAEVKVLGRASSSDSYLPQTALQGNDFESYAGSTNDLDNDELPDTWETQHGFDPTLLQSGDYSPAADPDRDGLHSALEAQLNTDPFSSDSVQGYLTVETWNDSLGYNVDDFVESDRFFQEPDIRKPIAGSLLQHVAAASGNRVRGYLTPTTTGVHYFWLSAADGAELWLSTDTTKYRKRRIAVMGGDAGTGHGNQLLDGIRFDRFASQMSEGIELVAGQTYFFEMLNQRKDNWGADLAVAWAPPGTDREFLPASVISSYGHQTEDDDNDYLPDAWETQYGLDPLDNGLTNRAGEGERGDFDLDGLSNREEFVAGTDPSNADSDNDGLNDFQELHSYGTDPTQSDAPSETLVSSVDLSTFSGNTSNWTLTSNGLISELFRGSISWNFNVPAQGYWNINVSTRLLGDLYLHETVPVDVLIDGQLVSSQSLIFGNQRQALLRATTPELSAGNHLLTLRIDNILARRSVSILGIDILEPTGADLDGDGLPDWIESRLTEENFVSPYLATSRTSPAFFEGHARLGVTLNGSSTNEGTDRTHWYADLPLNEIGSTPFTALFEGGLEETGSITWTATNILDNENLVIRQGDSLKLSATPATGSTGQDATVTLPAQTNYALDPAAVATQIGTPFWKYHAALANDGETLGTPNWDAGLYRSTKTTDDDFAWWQIDLGQERSIDKIVIWNEDPSKWQLANFKVEVIDDSNTVVLSQNFYDQGIWGQHVGEKEIWNLGGFYNARIVKIQKLGPTFGQRYLSLAEVQVFGIASQTLPDNESFIYQFDHPGTQLVDVVHPDGHTGTLTVEVKKATFDTIPQDLLTNTVGNLTFDLSEIDSDLHFDGGVLLPIDQQANLIGDSFHLRAQPRKRGSGNVLARLYEDGPVLASQPVNFIVFSDALQNDLTAGFLSQEFPGYVNLTTPIVASGLPSGGTVIVRIFRAGVTFPDGTKTKTLTSADFVNDVAFLDFLFPQGLEGGYCHHLDIYDRNGTLLGRR